jgi:hypothetical protein
VRVLPHDGGIAPFLIFTLADAEARAAMIRGSIRTPVAIDYSRGSEVLHFGISVLY